MTFQAALKALAVSVGIFVSACGINGPGEPSIEKIKGDLVGKSLGNPFLGKHWPIRSLSEVESMEVVDKRKGENIIEYKLDAILKSIKGGQYEGKRYTSSLDIVYRYENNQWTMVSLTPGKDVYTEIRK